MNTLASFLAVIAKIFIWAGLLFIGFITNSIVKDLCHITLTSNLSYGVIIYTTYTTILHFILLFLVWRFFKLL